MNGNHVVVLSSLIAAELAVKNAVEAVLQAPSPWVVLAIMLLAIYALAHQVRLVVGLSAGGGASHPRSSVRFCGRLLLASLLRTLLKLVQPPRQAGAAAPPVPPRGRRPRRGAHGR